MICTTYFLTFFSELIPPTGYKYNDLHHKWFLLVLYYLCLTNYYLVSGFASRING